MRRTGRVKWGNMKVGILVTFAIAVVLYSSFSGGGVSIFTPKDHLVVYLPSVNGLLKGASVRLAGVEVGTVKSIKFVNLDPERRLEVKLNVEEAVWNVITVDSKVQLGTIGLLGDKYIEIFPGSPDSPVVGSGAVLAVKQEVGLDAIVQKSPEMTESIDLILANLKDASNRIALGQGSVGKMITDTSLYDNLVATLDQLTHLMSDIQSKQKQILDRLGGTLESTASITGKMDAGTGSLGQLVNDTTLYANITQTAGRLDSILAKIDRGEGSAGALINDARLYEEIRDLVVRVNNLVDDIEKNPHKYFKFSIF